MILASTLSSAAVGVTMDSARIQRDLALDQGGKAESTVWFDGKKLPAVLAARVNAAASDAAASDDSDMRNIAHFGTTLTAAGLALGERTRASGRDLLPLRQCVRDQLGTGVDARLAYGHHDVLLAVVQVGHGRARLLGRHLHLCRHVRAGLLVVGA